MDFLSDPTQWTYAIIGAICLALSHHLDAIFSDSDYSGVTRGSGLSGWLRGLISTAENRRLTMSTAVFVLSLTGLILTGLAVERNFESRPNAYETDDDWDTTNSAWVGAAMWSAIVIGCFMGRTLFLGVNYQKKNYGEWTMGHSLTYAIAAGLYVGGWFVFSYVNKIDKSDTYDLFSLIGGTGFAAINVISNFVHHHSGVGDQAKTGVQTVTRLLEITGLVLFTLAVIQAPENTTA